MIQQALEAGIQGEKCLTVTQELTAAALKSGLLPVFATPAMLALMEDTAAASVQAFLPAGCSTVGTRMDVRHLAATPVGNRVRCKTELIEVDRRKLTFSCKVWDERELIGEGTQERFIVENERFMNKALLKRG